MAEKQLGVAPSNSTDAVTKAYVDSGIASLANKTISGSSNTISNIALGSLASAAYNTTPTASTLAEWDSDKNLSANAFVPGFTSVTTAAGTTTLTSASANMIQFTGSTTQTCVLPNATTLAVGRQFVLSNRSTGNVQVNMNGGSALQTLFSVSQATVTLTNNGTSAGTWDIAYLSTGGSTGLAATATVSTAEATTSTSYTDLTTTTDQVTVTIGASGMALVSLFALDTASQGGGSVSYAISGANTASATDSKSGMELIGCKLPGC